MDTAAKRIAFIQAQTVGAMARIEAMKAMNACRERSGYAQAYTEADFDRVPEEFGIGHNQVVSYLSEVN